MLRLDNGITEQTVRGSLVAEKSRAVYIGVHKTPTTAFLRSCVQRQAGIHLAVTILHGRGGWLGRGIIRTVQIRLFFAYQNGTTAGGAP
jgi:hypothetical protein